MTLDDLLRRYDCAVAGENDWQVRVRLLQALWRTRRGYGAGLHRGRPLGSRVPTELGTPPTLANYLTPAAKEQVLAAVRLAEPGALLSRPRLWVDLLSSQPLCFNLFGDMANDLDLATRALRIVWPQIERVTEIRFEYSPGRGDPRYTGNRSAFDVFVSYRRADGAGFLGIEVKYHEDLKVTAAADPDGRYRQLARGTAAFRDDAFPRLEKPPLQQLWLDHLLALRMRTADAGQWAAGTFVLLYPVANRPCRIAATEYRTCLSTSGDFDAVTLEELVSAIRHASGEPWADELCDRYLNPAVLPAAGVPPIPLIALGRRAIWTPSSEAR